MDGGGPFQLKPGQWTDDTSMALCLAESLILKEGFDPSDQMKRYLLWMREGYLSSTGECFDVGTTVKTALKAFERDGRPLAGPTDPGTAGNGCLMRLAPVPLAYARRPREAIEKAAQSSLTTHGARECLDACRYFAGLIVGALQGDSKEAMLSAGFCPVPGLWRSKPLAPKIAEIASGSFKKKEPPAIAAKGYVVDCLEAALWAFERSRSFEDGALRAVNLGDDADTVGAVYGQLAGAYYGAEAIPAAWREKLARRAMIESFAARLLGLSKREFPLST